MQIPPHYRQPIRAYPVSAARTVAVEGFVQDQFRVTGEAGSAAFGSVNTSVGSGGFSSFGHAVQGEYVPTSEAEAFRQMLAQTGCLRVVVNRDKADLIVVGQAGSEGRWGQPGR